MLKNGIVAGKLHERHDSDKSLQNFTRRGLGVRVMAQFENCIPSAAKAAMKIGSLRHG